MKPLMTLVMISALLPVQIKSQVGEVPYLEQEYDSKKWPEVKLNLSPQGSLKDIFDAGLRPYRFPTLENSVLEVKHFRLHTVLTSGKSLPEFPVELMSMHPFADGELSTLEARTPSLTVKEARSYMRRWLPYGKAVNGSPSTQDLENYLNAVQKDLMDFDHIGRGFDKGCRVSWKEPGWKTEGGGASCVVFFRKTSSSVKPLYLNFKFSWALNRKSKHRKYYREPIPPPPAYEHVSMKAPKNFGPDSMVNILKSQGHDIGDGKGSKSMPGSAVELEKETRKPSRASKENFEIQGSSTKTGGRKWPIILTVLIVTSGLLIWIKARFKKES